MERHTCDSMRVLVVPKLKLATLYIKEKYCSAFVSYISKVFRNVFGFLPQLVLLLYLVAISVLLSFVTDIHMKIARKYPPLRTYVLLYSKIRMEFAHAWQPLAVLVVFSRLTSSIFLAPQTRSRHLAKCVTDQWVTDFLSSKSFKRHKVIFVTALLCAVDGR